MCFVFITIYSIIVGYARIVKRMGDGRKGHEVKQWFLQNVDVNLDVVLDLDKDLTLVAGYQARLEQNHPCPGLGPGPSRGFALAFL